jgi:hypothetical protein
MPVMQLRVWKLLHGEAWIIVAWETGLTSDIVRKRKPHRAALLDICCMPQQSLSLSAIVIS